MTNCGPAFFFTKDKTGTLTCSSAIFGSTGRVCLKSRKSSGTSETSRVTWGDFLQGGLIRFPKIHGISIFTYVWLILMVKISKYGSYGFGFLKI